MQYPRRFAGLRQPSAARDGASRDRTGDLVLAKHALSQLSYGPVGGSSLPARSSGNDRVQAACAPRGSALREYDELARASAGFHVGVGGADLVEGVDLMDRHGEAARGDAVEE